MTDISKIKIDNNELLIKDSEARQNLISLSTNINDKINGLSTNISTNYLPLYGGELTGNLSIRHNNEPLFITSNSTLTLGTPPSSNLWVGGLNITDKDYNSFSYIDSTYGPSGSILYLLSRNKINGSNNDAYIQISSKNDGTKEIKTNATISLANPGLQYPEQNSYYTNAYGNFVHTTTAAGSFNIMNYNGSSVFSVGWETGYINNATWKGKTIDIEHGGTNATTRIQAVKNLFDSGITSPNYFLTITNQWGNVGYTSVDNVWNTIKTKTDSTYLKLSGGTLTGNCSFKRTALDTSATSRNQNTYVVAVGVTDTNDDLASYQQTVQYTSGEVGFQIAARRHINSTTTHVDNSISLFVDNNGTRRVSVDKASWRTALDLDKFETVSVSFNSNIQNGTIEGFKIGKLVMIRGTGKIVSQVDNGGLYVGTITNYLPKTTGYATLYFAGGNSSHAALIGIEYTGYIKIFKPFAMNENVNFSVMYYTS